MLVLLFCFLHRFLLSALLAPLRAALLSGLEVVLKISPTCFTINPKIAPTLLQNVCQIAAGTSSGELLEVASGFKSRSWKGFGDVLEAELVVLGEAWGRLGRAESGLGGI